MNKNKVEIISSNNTHIVKDGVVFCKPAGVTPMAGKDNRMYLVYDLGIGLTIPAGMIALVLPPNESSKFSVAQSGNFVLLPGIYDKAFIEYKVNTDAIPRVFEKDETCAQIVFISNNTIEFETIIKKEELKQSDIENESNESEVLSNKNELDNVVNNEVE